jgi:hypothetical protein
MLSEISVNCHRGIFPENARVYSSARLLNLLDLGPRQIAVYKMTG